MGTAHQKPDDKLKPKGHPYVGVLYATAAGPWILMGRVWINRVANNNTPVLLAHKEHSALVISTTRGVSSALT